MHILHMSMALEKLVDYIRYVRGRSSPPSRHWNDFSSTRPSSNGMHHARTCVRQLITNQANHDEMRREGGLAFAVPTPLPRCPVESMIIPGPANRHCWTVVIVHTLVVF